MLLRSLVIVLLCVQTLALQAQAGAALRKRINWETRTTDFRKVLASFEEITGVFFQYDAALTPAKRKFEVSYRNEIASVALRDFLHRYGLDYGLVLDQALVLKPWKPIDNALRISGSLTNAMTGERIIGATVYAETDGRVVYSNSQGIFHLRSIDTVVILGIYYSGFQPIRDTIFGRGKTLYRPYTLFPELDRLEEAEVRVKRQTDLPRTEEGWTDRVAMSGSQLEKFPHFFGEVDVLRALSATPGVVSGSEGVFGMYVRGGAADQNLVLLDDVPIYNAYHMYGLFGVFNGDIIKNAQFYRGTFPANHGGRLSSVIQVDTKEGDPEQFQGSVNLGLLSSRLFLTGPLFSKRTSFMIAARRSFFDFLVGPIVSNTPLGEGGLINRYNFWDLNAKITHRFSERSRLTLMAYSGQDYAGLIDQQVLRNDDRRTVERAEDVSRWGNDVVSIKWNWSSGTGTSFLLKSYYTSYKFSHDRLYRNEVRINGRLEDLESSNYEVSNGIYDVETAFEWSQQWTSRLKSITGMGYTYHSFRPNRKELISSNDSVEKLFLFSDEQVNTPEINGFMKWELTGGIWGNYDLGMRVVYYDLGLGQYYVLPEPRFNARWKLGKKAWLKASVSQNRQFFHQLNNLSMGLPSDLWVPSTAKFKPAQSRQRSIGFSHAIGKHWQWQLEAFQRDFRDILEYSESAVYITSNRNWEQSVTSGTGDVEGVEWQLQRSGARWSGLFSYTWMRNSRQFKDINGGVAFPSRYDRRHNIYVTVFYKLNREWSFSGSWMYNSGFAYTRPVGILPSPTSSDPAQDIYLYGARNNLRAIDNHRLDFSFTYEKASPGKIKGTWVFGVYNAYNRLNPFYINLGLGEGGNRSLYQVSLLPVLPFINYQIHF